MFYFQETACKLCAFFPAHTLQKPRRLWKDPCADLAGKDWKELTTSFLELERASSIRMVLLLCSLIVIVFKKKRSKKMCCVGAGCSVAAHL